jgi:hypothetical protein
MIHARIADNPSLADYAGKRAAVLAYADDRDRLQRELEQMARQYDAEHGLALVETERADRLQRERDEAVMALPQAIRSERARLERERDAALALVTKLREALRDAADGLVPAIGDPAVREVQRRARACLAAEEPR